MKTLNQKLLDYFNEIMFDYDEEEIRQVIEILDGLNDDLSDMSQLDKTLLQRMVDDSELYDEIENARTFEDEPDDPFA